MFIQRLYVWLVVLLTTTRTASACPQDGNEMVRIVAYSFTDEDHRIVYVEQRDDGGEAPMARYIYPTAYTTERTTVTKLLLINSSPVTTNVQFNQQPVSSIPDTTIPNQAPFDRVQLPSLRQHYHIVPHRRFGKLMIMHSNHVHETIPSKKEVPSSSTHVMIATPTQIPTHDVLTFSQKLANHQPVQSQLLTSNPRRPERKGQLILPFSYRPFVLSTPIVPRARFVKAGLVPYRSVSSRRHDGRKQRIKNVRITRQAIPDPYKLNPEKLSSSPVRCTPVYAVPRTARIIAPRDTDLFACEVVTKELIGSFVVHTDQRPYCYITYDRVNFGGRHKYQTMCSRGRMGEIIPNVSSA